MTGIDHYILLKKFETFKRNTFYGNTKKPFQKDHSIIAKEIEQCVTFKKETLRHFGKQFTKHFNKNEVMQTQP